jgi:hypothetical protein
MALPIFAEYMQRVYADTINTGIHPIPFEISRSIDVKLDCDDSLDSIEEEF